MAPAVGLDGAQVACGVASGAQPPRDFPSPAAPVSPTTSISSSDSGSVSRSGHG